MFLSPCCRWTELWILQRKQSSSSTGCRNAFGYGSGIFDLSASDDGSHSYSKLQSLKSCTAISRLLARQHCFWANTSLEIKHPADTKADVWPCAWPNSALLSMWTSPAVQSVISRQHSQLLQNLLSHNKQSPSNFQRRIGIFFVKSSSLKRLWSAF